MTANRAPLPRGGRHPLTREAVAASQRERLLQGIAEAVCEKGYASTTVADVIRAAGVSRRTFYENFDGLESCFLTAYREGRRRLQQRIRQAMLGLPASDRPQRIRASLQAYLSGLAAEPEMTWAFTIEVFGAGPAARAEREQVMAFWVEQWTELLRHADSPLRSAAPVSELRILALVGGVEELVRHELQRGGAQALPGLLDEAVLLANDVLR